MMFDVIAILSISIIGGDFNFYLFMNIWNTFFSCIACALLTVCCQYSTSDFVKLFVNTGTFRCRWGYWSRSTVTFKSFINWKIQFWGSSGIWSSDCLSLLGQTEKRAESPTCTQSRASVATPWWHWAWLRLAVNPAHRKSWAFSSHVMLTPIPQYHLSLQISDESELFPPLC